MNNIIENKEYKIARLDKSNLRDVEKLHTAIYGKNPPYAYFKKKYDTAYAGVLNMGFIAYNNENLAIAYYGVIPCFIQYAGKIILAAQSADTMTHPAYRSKGLFMKLANICFDLCSKNDIQLIFGFPNQNSYHGFIKLGWKTTETMDCFTIPVKAIPIQDFFLKSTVTKSLYEKYVKLVLRKYFLTEQGLPNSLINEGYGGVHRDTQYLQYKTYSNTQVITINESKLWIKINNGLIIGDIALAENNFDELMNMIKKLSKKLGIRQIYFHACRQTRLHSLFAERYNSIPSFPVIFKDFGSGIPLDEIKFTFADIDVF